MKRTLMAASAGLLISATALSSWHTQAGKTDSTPMNAIAERYVRTVLALGQHDKDYVDAYYGPPEWKRDADASKVSLDAIAAQGRAVRADLLKLPPGSDELSRLRHQYLDRQLASLDARIRILKGEKLSFDDESKALYDAVAPTHQAAHFQQLLDSLDKRFPGQGTLAERYDAWRRPFAIPREKLDAVFQTAIKACRDRTVKHVTLPDNERFTVEYVNNKSWSGYNWYQGDFRSLIQVNTDLPIYIDRAIDLACHEGYPGHHVYNALLEKHLVRDRGWMEFTVYPLFSPQSLIAEGTANYGIEMAFTDAERRAFERSVLFPAAGLDPSKADRVLRNTGARGQARVRRQRSRALVPRRPDICRRCRRISREVRALLARAREAARPLHGAVPQLRHQLQPGQGHGPDIRRIAQRRRPREALVGVREAPVVAEAAVGPAVIDPDPSAAIRPAHGRLLRFSIILGVVLSLATSTGMMARAVIVGSVDGGWVYPYAQPPDLAMAGVWLIYSAGAAATLLIPWRVAERRPWWTVVTWMVVATALQGVAADDGALPARGAVCQRQGQLVSQRC